MRRQNITYRWTTLAYLSAILFTSTSSNPTSLEPAPYPTYPPTLETRVQQILKETPLIDGHNDLAYFLRWAYSHHIYLDNFTTPFETGGLDGQVDLIRLRQGQVGGTFWSIYEDCPKEGNYSLEYFAKAVPIADAAVDVIHRIHALYPSTFARPSNASDTLSIFNTGRIISPLGLESLHLIGNSFSKLRDFHARGVRYATLTHNCHNIYADAAVFERTTGNIPAVPLWGGVSPIGRTLVREMNRLGMLVDLSHTSADTQRDVLGGHPEEWEGSLAPPMFSHSSVFALCPHPRNVPDDVLQLVKARRGVVMVNFWKGFVGCRWPGNGTAVPGQLPGDYTPNQTLSYVVRHIRYIGDLIGYDYVGLGSDFDGVPSAIEGLEDVSKFPNLVAEMLRQGIKEADVRKIVGENILRVWSEVDEVAARLQAEGALPAEDDLAWVPNPWT
ncbi:renal dipeptidase family [Massariosphaeria phaeospora]|uniref:Dipeptidase n=1 Tax=Massariosphaeria phaeospora TaxID=100035 RepID=A0A7C8M6Z1_9PLEO|nr:renal dipeptidase family [Massariosphaeria phaeospora]